MKTRVFSILVLCIILTFALGVVLVGCGDKEDHGIFQNIDRTSFTQVSMAVESAIDKGEYSLASTHPDGVVNMTVQPNYVSHEGMDHKGNLVGAAYYVERKDKIYLYQKTDNDPILGCVVKGQNFHSIKSWYKDVARNLLIYDRLEPKYNNSTKKFEGQGYEMYIVGKELKCDIHENNGKTTKYTFKAGAVSKKLPDAPVDESDWGSWQIKKGDYQSVLNKVLNTREGSRLTIQEGTHKTIHIDERWRSSKEEYEGDKLTSRAITHEYNEKNFDPMAAQHLYRYDVTSGAWTRENCEPTYQLYDYAEMDKYLEGARESTYTYDEANDLYTIDTGRVASIDFDDYKITIKGRDDAFTIVIDGFYECKVDLPTEYTEVESQVE